jgi:hypothetical protein
MKLQKISTIGLLILILLLSIIIGHFLPPAGILVSPIIIAVMAGLVVLVDNGFNILAKSVLCYLFIGLNDIGIKLFSGGIHDSEGLGWINMMLFIGLVPSFAILLIGVFRDKTTTYWTKTLSILMFIVLVYIHLQLFQILGIQKNYT